MAAYWLKPNLMGPAGSRLTLGSCHILRSSLYLGPSSPRLGPSFLDLKGVRPVLKTTLIAAAVAVTAPTHAQQSQRGVTVITPYSVHVYSADPATPGRLLDDENLQRQNEREQRARVMRQMEREREVERQEAD